MRIVVERSQFLKSLNHVQSVVERRNTILSNILLQAKGGKIRLTATDLDVEVVETLDGDIAREGATTVPAHMLHDIVRKLPDGTQIEIVQGPDDKRLSLHSGRSRFTLQSLPPEDFPDMTAGDLSHRFPLGASDLKNLIDSSESIQTIPPRASGRTRILLLRTAIEFPLIVEGSHWGGGPPPKTSP